MLKLIRDQITSRSARDSLGSLALRLVGLAATFALGVALARVLGPAEYGRYGLVITLSALAMTLAHLGTPQLAVRELSILKAKRSWAEARSLVLSLLKIVTISSGCVAALMISLAYSVPQIAPDERALITAGSLLMFLMALTALMASELRGLGALLKGQFFDIVGRPTFACLAVAAALLSGWRLSALDAVWIQVAAAALATIISMGWLRSSLPAKREERGTTTAGRGLVFVAVPLLLIDLIRQVDGSYTIILMAWFANDATLGIYRVAVACGTLLSMPVTIAHIVYAPQVASLAHSNNINDLQKLLVKISLLLTMLLLPVAVLTWLFAEPVMTFVFGPAYAPASRPLAILAIAQLAFGFFGMGPIVLAMAKGERALVGISLLGVSLGAIAAVPLILFFGASGAAMAQVLSFTTIGALSNSYARRNLNLDLTLFGSVNMPEHARLKPSKGVKAE